MTGIQWGCALRAAGYVLAFSVALVVMAQPAQAQQVAVDYPNYCTTDDEGGYFCAEGTIEMTIIYTSDGAEVDVAVNTYINACGSFEGMAAYAEYDLYLNGQEIGAASGQGGQIAATGRNFTGMPVGYQDAYTLWGVNEGSYEDYYDDGDDDGGGGAGGSAYVVLDANWPYIGSLSPTSVAVGGSGTMNVTGYNLLNPSTCTSTAAATGVDFSFSSGDCAYGDYANFNYSVNGNAGTGAQTLTVANGFGTSNGVTFNIDDPTPVITGISPSTWDAGWTNHSVAITGTGFGTGPTLSISDSSITCTGIVVNNPGPTNAQLSCNASVPANHNNSSVTVTLTSHGYNGSGFAPLPGGSSGSPPSTVDIAAYVPPAATIQYFNGAIPPTVYVGQLISLTTNAGSISALPPTSYYWSFNGSNPLPAIAGYNASSTGSTVTPLTNLTSSGITFYWVSTGPSSPASASQGVSFYYCVNNSLNQCSVTSNATFAVESPTDINVTLDQNRSGDPFAPVSIWLDSVPWMGLGQIGSADYGLWLLASMNTPSGWNPVNPSASTSWVQVFTSMTFRELDGSGTWTGYFAGQISPSGTIYSTVLDTSFPYGNGSIFSDDPQSKTQYSEFSQNYSSTVYLMWDPAVPPVGQQTCSPAIASGDTVQPSTCSSIPVPLGHVSWGACGDGVNTLANVPSTQTNWTLNCPSETGPSPFVSDATYPSWQSTISGSQVVEYTLDH